MVNLVEGAGWAPWLVWTVAENLPAPGFNPWTVQPVASRHTVYAIAAHIYRVFQEE